MPQATQAAFDARASLDDEALEQTRSAVALGDLRIAIHESLGTMENEWRAFERTADCTVFQSYDWVSTWQRDIGMAEGVVPVVVTIRDGQGALLCLLPLGIERGGGARRLTWLGTVLCDYNGPMLAPSFAEKVDAARFAATWHDILHRLQTHPRFRFDVVHFDKMQMTVGAQPNPFIGLGVFAHADGAYVTQLGADWEKFYTDKRSSATRRRDRTKRKKMAEAGEVRFVTPPTPADVNATLATLIGQKSAQLKAMGVANIFDRPGHRAFYESLAAQPAFVHVSRLEVGAQTAAANLGLIFRGSYYHLLASYDGGEISKFGPGAAHMHDLLRYAIEQGCGAFDFTIGDERYKQEWSDRTIVLYDHVSVETLRGIPSGLKLHAVGRIKRKIKQTPALWNAAFKLRTALGPIMRRLRG